jgi:hypothetical protein
MRKEAESISAPTPDNKKLQRRAARGQRAQRQGDIHEHGQVTVDTRKSDTERWSGGQDVGSTAEQERGPYFEGGSTIPSV